MKSLIFTVCALILTAQPAAAGWFDWGSKGKEEPKILTKSEKQKIITGICNCAVGSDTQYANTAAEAEYEQRIRPLMNKLAESLRKDYMPTMNVNCSGGGYQMVAGARKKCMATYQVYGSDRELKAEAEELK